MNGIFNQNQFGPSDQHFEQHQPSDQNPIYPRGIVNGMNQSAIDTCHICHMSTTCQMKSLIEINLDRPIKISSNVDRPIKIQFSHVAS